MFKRYLQSRIIEALTDTPVVYVMGPRQSGKTTLVKNLIDPQWTYISFDDSAQLLIAQSDPVGFVRNFNSNKPVVLDEVQRIPELFVSLKQSVDELRRPARFLLTGSANALLLPTLSDSLAGRMEMIHLATLSESEILNKKPTFLTKILADEAPVTESIRIRAHLIKRIVTGCFPEPIQRRNESRIQAWYDNYINSLIQRDIQDLSHIEQHGEMTKLLNVLCLYSAQLINFTELGGKLELYRTTVKKYTALLEQLFLVEQLPAWHTNAYKRLIKTPKIHMADTGIICAARGIRSETINKNPDLLGALLETFVYNELRKQASFIDEKLNFYHYRDKDGYEVDIIIENNFGEVIGIEVKAAASIQAKDLKGLKRLKDITGDQFKLGILLYDGDHTSSFGDKLFAVPIAALWSE